MRKLLLLFVLSVLPFVVWGQTTKEPLYREGQVIVKFKTSPNKARGAKADNSVSKALQLIGGTNAKQLMPLTGSLPAKSRGGNGKNPTDNNDLSGLYVLQFDKSRSVDTTIKKLEELDDVEYAEPNYIRRAFGSATDFTSASLYNSQWYLSAINMPYLWDQPIVNDKRPLIAILDTGIDFSHPNLKNQSRYNNFGEDYGFNGEDDDNNGYIDDGYGWDFIYNTAMNPYDKHGHGTHCAGIAAGASDNGDGIVGANPDAKILGVRVLDENGDGDDATIILGVNYAIAIGADILSMSFGENYPNNALQDALQNASQYAILIAAAGNDKMDIDVPFYPAAYPFVIGVEATNEEGELASFSNYDADGRFTEGCNYDVRAPGVNMLSTYPTFGSLRGVGYARLDGTSLACPLVAGAVSRLMQCGKVTDFNSLRDLLIKTSGLTVDMKAAYDATTETMNAETFECDINGVMMKFHKTSATTAQVGDGINSAVSTSTVGSVSVPNDVHGLLVTSIANNAFNGCGQITEISLPWNINNIGSHAFTDCSQLGQLRLQSIDVPTCSANAFDNETFASCHVEVPKDCGDAYQANAVWGRFSTNLNAQLYAQGDYISKDIGDYCFSLIVTSERNKQVALWGVDPLNDLNEVDGIVTVPESVDGFQITSLGYDGNGAFSNRSWLKQVVLPDCITEISNKAFFCCYNLETVNFPASLRSIGSYAFRDCIAFKNGHVPGSVKTICGNAFENSGVENLIIDEGVERIDLNAFDHCLSLKTIQIPSTVISIFESFEDLPNVESIEVAEGNPYYDSRNNCNAIISTKEAFLVRGCKNTVIPNDIKNVSGFWGTKGLTEVNLSKNVEFLSSESFRACEDLTSITVNPYNQTFYSPSGSNVILGWGTVYALCSNSVIPEETTFINSLSAYRNSHITSVTIPTAMNICSLAFGGCPITSVTSLAKRPMAISGDAFYDSYYNWYETDHRTEDAIYANATLYVPHGTKEIYIDTDGWNQFQNIVELDPVITGDIDGNGNVNEADRLALIDHLIGKVKNIDGYNATAADVDGDGRVNARDIAALADVLAGKEPKTDDEEASMSIGEQWSIHLGGKSEICLDFNPWAESDDKPVAFHERIILPEGMSFVENQEVKADGDGLETYCMINGNQADVVVASLNNKAISSEVVLQINVATETPHEGHYSIFQTLVMASGKMREESGSRLYMFNEEVEEPVEITPITETVDKKFSNEINESTILSNAVNGNTYFNINGNNGDYYDTEEQAIVLKSTTSEEQMSTIQGAEVGDDAIRENYHGIIIEVAAGSGTISVDAQTIGTHTLNLQIGSRVQKKISNSERKTEEVTYNVSNPTYVYLYASPGNTNAARTRASEDNSVLLYGYSVTLDEKRKGDVNEDNNVDETDLQLVVDYIMNPSEDFNKAAADMDGDGDVNAADVVLIINAMTNQN